MSRLWHTTLSADPRRHWWEVLTKKKIRLSCHMCSIKKASRRKNKVFQASLDIEKINKNYLIITILFQNLFA